MTINIHATGLVLDGVGLILRGPSGAGKSILALALLERWADRGRQAVLVADDRVDVGAIGAGLEMRAPERIAGLIELRGRGIVTRPHVAAARLHLVIDLVPDYARMVEESELVTELEGIALPRCPVPQAGLVPLEHQILLVNEALRSLVSDGEAARQKST